MENVVPATTLITPATTDPSLKPRFRKKAERPRMRWEYSTAELSKEAMPDDCPKGEITYHGVYHFREFGGYKQKIVNGLSVL